MKRWCAVLGCVVYLAPAVTAASELSLQIGPRTRPTEYDAYSYAGSRPLGRQPFDVQFNETGPAEDESLVAYDLALRLVRPWFAGPQQVVLAGAERPGDNFVLDAAGGSTFEVIESDANHVKIHVASNGGLADITTGKKAARVFYAIDPSVVEFGDYSIVVDTTLTSFISGSPNRPGQIPVVTEDRGLIGVYLDPEPGTLSLLAVAGALSLLRRWAPSRTRT